MRKRDRMKQEEIFLEIEKDGDFEKDLTKAEAELTDTRLRDMSRYDREEAIRSIKLALNAEKCTGKSCLCLVIKRRSVFFSVMLGLHFQDRGGT